MLTPAELVALALPLIVPFDSVERGRDVLSAQDSLLARRVALKVPFDQNARLDELTQQADPPYLYGFAGEKEPQSELTCVEWKSGKTLWSYDTKQEVATVSGDPGRGGGRVIETGRPLRNLNRWTTS